MSWFSFKSSSKTSEFFKGINIFKQLNNSVFGKIKNTINELFGNEFNKEYILPKVIVIGNESAGKSCLLENITKCQLFPRDAKICTKCPIHLKLNTSDKKSYSVEYNGVVKVITKKNDIYNEVKSKMDEIKDGFISSEEIIINISEPNLPVFEFFDLPGIVSYPPENAKQTLDLSKKYLKEKNTIVLCVVPATITRLTSCQSIALIKEMNMEENSILALTMSDRVLPLNIPDLLINRLLQTSDELKDLHFNGYVAVVNRTHDDSFSLEENDKNEIDWFTKNIISGIPKSHQKEADTILQNITVNNLIKQLDKLYSKYIEKEWKPSVYKKIEEKEKKILDEIKVLGILPGNIDYDKYIPEIMENIKSIYEESYKFTVNSKIFPNFKIINGVPLKLNHSYIYHFLRSIIDNLDSKIVNKILEEKVLPKILKYFDKKGPLVLERFSIIQDKILQNISDHCIDFWKTEKDRIINNLHVELDIFINKIIDGVHFNDFNNIISYKLIIIIFDYLNLYFYNYITITSSDFIENSEYYEKRIKLNNELKKVHEHKAKISNIVL